MNTELFEKLSRLQWLLHRQHIKAHAAGGPAADSSRGQGRILAFLRMKDGVSTKDLSYLLGISVSSLNELLVKLEKGGYITRMPSEADKRVVLIFLTQKGREEEEAEQPGGDVFGCLSADEQAALGEYLDRVIAALEAELGTDGERGGMHVWMRAARERMGPEQFDDLMSKRFSKLGMRGEPFGRGRHGGHGGHHKHGGHKCERVYKPIEVDEEE